MKTHSTNYRNTLVEVAEDCPAKAAEIPPVKDDKKSIANLQFDLLYEHPYAYTSDDFLFKVHAMRHNIPKNELKDARKEFFSKGQPCMRTSPLTKRYGWGVHNNADEKIAIFGIDSPEYKKLQKDKALAKVKAMRSSKSK